MRIAVLVYGRLNNAAKHYRNIVDAFGTHDLDFFLSSDNSSESLLNEFTRLYKPVRYINSPIHYDRDLGKYPGKRDETNIHNMTCHFINKNRVFALLEEHVHATRATYDCVVSLRIDCVFQNKFVFDALAEDTIYIPQGSDHVEKAINDQIAYGKPDVMKKYNSIDPVYLLENRLSIPHPESLNYANIQFHALQVVRVELNYYLDK